MDAPIYRFLKRYSEIGNARFHMPGHKGAGELCEELDLTEVDGADSLYEASGIIAESERNASELFGSYTVYSTEGSSLSIRAMLYLISLYASERGERAEILAARNVHKSFVSAAALLDFDVEWLTSDRGSYLSCPVSAVELRERFASAKKLPTAVYLTSPDYLGNLANIREIAEACHDFGVLLAVDNAHGAYLKFLSPSLHPIDLGADICCDSAHKTLPVLTGGGYLHVSYDAPALLRECAKDAMAMFGSTSPSYLILASLDLANSRVSELCGFTESIKRIREILLGAGYNLIGDEPMKITIDAKAYGYLGTELSCELLSRGVTAEFSDPDFLVLMLSPSNSEMEIEKLVSAMLTIPKRGKIATRPPTFGLPERVLSPRAVSLLPRERLPVAECVGRTLAAVTVGCPPAVPIAVMGERIDADTVAVFEYYGIETAVVTKN